MEKIKLSEITIDKIKDRALKNVIPELYELEGIIENNGSHINQPVFEHILSTLTALEELLPQQQLLFLATVLHDIGKKETMKKDGDTIKFPNHEEAGAKKLETILSRFDLSEKEKNMVVEIIRNHGFFHNLLDRRSNLDLDQKISEFRKINPDVFNEVVLLTIADLRGGHLMKNNPEEFNFRVNFLNDIIKKGA